MREMKRVVAIMLTMLVAACVAPPLATAETASRSRTVSVSGADAMVVVLGSVRHLEIGSRASTLTLELSGRRVPITIGYEELTRSALGGNGGPGLLPLALIAVPLGQALRLAGRMRRSPRG